MTVSDNLSTDSFFKSGSHASSSLIVLIDVILKPLERTVCAISFPRASKDLSPKKRAELARLSHVQRPLLGNTNIVT